MNSQRFCVLNQTSIECKYKSLILNLLTMALAFFSQSALAGLPIDAVKISVERIVDGDTIVTAGGTRVRLRGIDTPERDQAYGSNATRALEQMLSQPDLYIEVKDIDRYGRTIGVLYTANGRDLNLEMVCGGHAWWYQKYAPLASKYEECQDTAVEEKRGLWAVEDPITPWDWRRRN